MRAEGISLRTLHRWRQQGLWKGERYGHYWYIRASELARLKIRVGQIDPRALNDVNNESPAARARRQAATLEQLRQQGFRV